MSKSLTQQMFESLEKKYDMSEEKPSKSKKKLSEGYKRATIRKVNKILKEAVEDASSFGTSPLVDELFAVEDEMGIADDWSDMDKAQQKESAEMAIQTLLANHADENLDLSALYDELKNMGFSAEAEALGVVGTSEDSLEEAMLTESEVDIEQFLGPDNYISENLKEEMENEADSDYEFLEDEFDTERELN